MCSRALLPSARRSMASLCTTLVFRGILTLLLLLLLFRIVDLPTTIATPAEMHRLAAAHATEQVDECPLQGLSQIYYDSHCFEEPNGWETVTVVETEVPLCCLDLFVGLARIVVQHANATGFLLLTKSQEDACFQELANMSSCIGLAHRLSAGNSGCAFARVEDLDLALKRTGDPGLSLGAVEKNCTYTQENTSHLDCSVCSNSVSDAVSALAKSESDEPFVCAGSLVIGLESLKVNDTTWSEAFYGCVRVVGVGKRAGPDKGSHLKVVLSTATVGAFLVGVAVAIWQAKRQQVISKEGNYTTSRKTPKESKQVEGSSYDSLDFVYSERLYTFSSDEIMKATNNFSPENFLGRGNAGEVYKGVLPSGQVVVVKKIDKNKQLETFLAELQSLSRVRHAHLVTLMGYCHCQDGDVHHLVYEYCCNGNLAEWLFSNSDSHTLLWEQRLKIAVNCARGLWFLHNYPGGSIVHRDIKPSNILLNEHMEAKLSDFGLSKYITMDHSRVFTEVKGTAGYLDPEYMSMGELTQASDVFSFGVVLLELISGKKAIETHSTNNVSIVKLARTIVTEGLGVEEFADPRLQGRYCLSAFERVFRVAVNCTSSSRVGRMTMKDVLRHLEGALHQSLMVLPVHPHVQGKEDASMEAEPYSV